MCITLQLPITLCSYHLISPALKHTPSLTFLLFTQLKCFNNKFVNFEAWRKKDLDFCNRTGPEIVLYPSNDNKSEVRWNKYCCDPHNLSKSEAQTGKQTITSEFSLEHTEPDICGSRNVLQHTKAIIFSNDVSSPGLSA